MASDVRDIQRLLRDLGYTLVRNNGHEQYEHPEQPALSLAASPSDHRWRKNTMAILRARHPELRPVKSENRPTKDARRARRGRVRQHPTVLLDPGQVPADAQAEVGDGVPSPGSPEAVAAGCACPVFANNHGEGLDGRPGIFEIPSTCPLHWEPTIEPDSLPVAGPLCAACGNPVRRAAGRPGRPRKFCESCRPSRWKRMSA